MSWVKLDDQFSHHPKVIQAGPLAGWLHVCALCYCASYLTDGFVPNGVINVLADFNNIGIDDADSELVTFGHDIEVGELVARLLEVGLWEPTKGGYLIHDYLKYNPSKAQVLHERAKNAQRQANYQNKHTTNAITNAVSEPSVTGAPYPYPYPSPSPRKREVLGVNNGGGKETQTQPAAVDPSFGAFVRHFEHEISMTNGTIAGQMHAIWDELVAHNVPDWGDLAIDVAVAQNKRSWSYVQGTLRNCLDQGRPPGAPHPGRNGSKPEGKEHPAITAMKMVQAEWEREEAERGKQS